MKPCYTCGIHKEYSEFHLRKGSGDGYHGHCKKCRSEYGRNHYRENTEAYAEQAKTYYANNKEEIVVYKKNYYQRKGRPKMLMDAYSLTEEDYNILYVNQQECCAVCKTAGSSLKRSLAVDHDHITGEIRGLLCNDCNRKFIGHRRNPELYEAAAQYLRQGTGRFIPIKEMP